MRISGRYSFTLVLLIAFFIAEAQKDKNATGFIITLQNDTLPCTFKQKNWKKQPMQIAVSYSGKDTSYSPETINGFFVTSPGVEFASRTTRLTNYTEKLQDATTSRVPEIGDPQKLFLKTLYKGNFTLYSFLDKLKGKRFFIEGPNNLVELYTHYYVRLPAALSNEIPVTVLDRSFEFVLKTLMNPCRALFNIIENIGLDEDQLVQVFKMYDMCLESKKEN